MRSTILTKAEFEKLKIHFSCKHDPATNGPIDWHATAADFEKMPADFGLFKIACRAEMANSSSETIAKLKKYLVFAGTTLFPVGAQAKVEGDWQVPGSGQHKRPTFEELMG